MAAVAIAAAVLARLPPNGVVLAPMRLVRLQRSLQLPKPERALPVTAEQPRALFQTTDTVGARLKVAA